MGLVWEIASQKLADHEIHSSKGGALMGDDTQRIRERAGKLWNEWFGMKVTKTGPELLADALTAERDAAIEQCCKDVCPYCRHTEHWQPAEVNEIGWLHRPVKDAEHAICEAASIRASVAQEKKDAKTKTS